MAKNKLNKHANITNKHANIILVNVSNHNVRLKKDLKLMARNEGFSTLSPYILHHLTMLRNNYPNIDMLRKENEG